MTSRKYLSGLLLSFLVFATVAASAVCAENEKLPAPMPSQSPAPPPPGAFPLAGNDATTSMGSFKIKINSKFVSMMSTCPNFDKTSNILSSGTLYDPSTIIGRSDVSLAGHDIANTPFELGEVNVGMAGTLIHKDRLIPPPMYPCFGDNLSTPPPSPSVPDHGPCASGTGTRKVDTEIRALNMRGPGGQAVRAGIHYTEDPFQPTPFADIMTSPGKVQSRSGPSNDPTRDFPATSFFNVYVKVDIPANYCGPSSPGFTLYNQDPLKVVNKMLYTFPPRVVYVHDASSIVPILFLTDGPYWKRGEVLGYFILAGHGVGFTNSQSDQTEFENFMSTQTNASCPIQ